MSLQSFGKALVSILNPNKQQDSQLNVTCALSETKRLLHRLNSIDLNEEEAKSLQCYLTTILEARHQNKTSSLVSQKQPGCIVLEMGEPELREFASYIGENVVRPFRAIVQSSKNSDEARKLTILGENGLRVFHVALQGKNHLMQQ